MIVRIVKMTFEPEHVPDFLNLFDGIKEKIRNVNGCEHLELLQDVRNKNILFTYTYWQSEGHLEAYRHSDLFKGVWANTKQFFSARAEAWSLQSKALLQ